MKCLSKIERGVGLAFIVLWLIDGCSGGAIAPHALTPIATILVYDHTVRITIVSYESSGSYKGEHGLTVLPTDGAQFLWVQVRAENVYQYTRTFSGGFFLIYKGKQISDFVAYNDARPGYAFFKGGQIPSGAVWDGWVRFTVPLEMNAPQAQIIFEATPGEEFTWPLAR